MIASYQKKVLVVDDDKDIRELMHLILEMEGYAVTELDNGHGVLEAIQTLRPDVVLLDVMLGDMDGRDICKHLKNDPGMQDIPIIIVSASHGLHTMHEKQCGANDYLAKPFDVNELVNHVRHFAA
ncbi:PleD family two-component system response regulator [Mucilaginibacter sp. Mucisp84]|jgi:CheY-like chemotaxis protein|uniref:response regulator n=1 Tax=Mucilaginibacter sp. Mucisp84 TaxID=3243058 RepID=UPI0039A62EDD